MTKLLDREQRLLAMLLATMPGVSPFAPEFSSGSPNMDWTRFEALVTRHRVAALVHSGLAAAPHITPPSDMCDRFAASTSANAQVFMRGVHVAGLLTTAMREAGIACAVLKGIGVAAHYYDQPSDREMIDIDLLVDPNRYEEAETIVRAHGFDRFYPKFALDHRKRASFRRLHNAMTFIRRNDGLQIDLHWRKVQNPVLMAHLDANWTRLLVEDEAAGLPIPMLRPAAHALYIAAHGIKHGWVRLKWLVDIDRVIRGMTSDEIVEMLDLAELGQLGKMLAASLDLSQRILGTPLPSNLQDLVCKHDTDEIIALQMPMIFAELPAREHSLKDWRHFIQRIRHSMLLHDGRGYRREALLRELARPADLEILSLSPAHLWLLSVLSPILGIGRLFRR
ncbi:nucleotidyltransferase domain-containing protein [Pontixanthobacter gangjinensis]|uniref:Uncharacterized protein n=1 Tax=Pontixanthobacter gangjinensis TaxID=1028742 RepID=A0A6I4SPN2_9SPHN|nr:nucleotidyltransferase family protein [Pontixanthobacter gangjinensis]MXO57599.1 hypothetical protein [Pontixanthobacter gangjinensis]